MSGTPLEVRLALISDVHGNPSALGAVLADIAARGIEVVYCLGDLVGYGPEPGGVIEMVRAAGIPTVVGNYDDGIAFERGGCGCLYPDDASRRVGDASYAFTTAAVTPEGKAWLRMLPREIRIQIVGKRVLLVHGSPRRIDEYLFPESDEATYKALAAGSEADVVAFGHTHRQWHRTVDGVLFVNAGSVGRPKDGDTRAAYTELFFDRAGSVDVRVHRVEYDVESVAASVTAAGLPDGLAEAFRRGE